MFEIRHSWQRWRAKNAYMKVRRAMDRDYAQKREDLRSHDAYHLWLAQWNLEIDIARLPYDKYRTSYWTRRAIGKWVEVPARNYEDGYWEQSPVDGSWALTDKGVATIRAAIRQETLASTELFFKIGILAAAVAGPLVGIASIIVALRS